LNSVTIGNGVTTINQYAFYNCSGLTSLTFSEVSHVETIGQFAFEKCSSLESLTIPVSVTSIGAGAFASCTSLTTLSIPVSATIAEDAKPFKKSESITTVTITGTGVITSTNPINIASGANNNNTVTTLIIGDDITGIGANAFSSRSSSITTLTLSSKVATIGDDAFRNCTGLTSLNVPASVTSIGVYAFNGCSNLGTVSLNSNPYIGAYAFLDIKADATVTMNLTGNEGETDEYWMTFYNLYYNFQVPATTQIFKAALTGSTLALTELTTDKIVKAGKPVILKSTTGPISLTLTSTASSNDFSGNDLKGVSNDAGLSGATDDIYVLNKKAGTGVGFYKLATSKTLGVGKAYLQTTSGSNFFGMDEETTGLKSIDNGQWIMDNYYDLSGRKVANPKKGLYIVNGKKIIIK
jgi:hypothetical protein